MRRFFVTQPIGDSQLVTLSGTDARHIRTVLRMQPGDDLVLLDGTGHEFHGRITRMDKRLVEANIHRRQHCANEPDLELTVAQALLKDKKMDRLVRRLTELGTGRFIPWMAHRSVPQPGSQRMAARRSRWERIAQEAMKQCRRGVLPQISAPINWEGLLTARHDYDLTLIFWEGARTSLTEIAAKNPPDTVQRLLLILGPEGGFQDEEIADAQLKNIPTVSLGPRILRADTAALAAGTLAQYIWGDLRTTHPNHNRESAPDPGTVKSP